MSKTPGNVADLIAVLGATDEEVRRQAIIALGNLKEPAEVIVPALVAALLTPDGCWIDEDAAEALVKIGRPAVPALIVALKRAEDEGLQVVVAEALGNIGCPGDVIASALVDVFRTSEWVGENADLFRSMGQPYLREVIAEALVKIGRPAIPALMRALLDPDRLVREDAAEILETIDPKALSRPSSESQLPDVAPSVEDQRILAWFDHPRTAEYIEQLQVFWCIGIIDREALHAVGPALGYGKLTRLLRERKPRVNLVPLPVSIGYIRETCLPELGGLFDREPFYSQAWSAEEQEPDLRVEHMDGDRPHGRWTPRAKKAWFYIDRFLTLRGLLPEIADTEAPG